MNVETLQNIIEAALMAAGRPLTVSQLHKLFEENDQVETSHIKSAIEFLRTRYQESGIELREVASGFQFQAKIDYAPWLSKLWEERPPRYSRAFLETLALIAYRQPITRSEIEDIRGVTASSNIVKTLLEREWIKVLGYKEVPGRPALYGTTKEFLDYFNLKRLDELPTLAELKDLESQEAKLQIQLELAQTEATANPEAETADETEATSEVAEETEATDETEAANEVVDEIEPTDETEADDTTEVSDETEITDEPETASESRENHE